MRGGGAAGETQSGPADTDYTDIGDKGIYKITRFEKTEIVYITIE